MTRINLLPWREELRRERMIQFVTLVVIVAVFSLVSVLGVHMYNESMVSNQELRNKTLEKEITLLDKQITEIRGLESTRDNLKARMKVIQDLQTGRPGIVHLFDEFVKTVPDGLYLEFLQQNGGVVTIKGVAQSNGRVSEYMSNLNNSGWMTNPKLDVITAKGRERQFSLTVTQADPNQANADEAAKSAAGN